MHRSAQQALQRPALLKALTSNSTTTPNEPFIELDNKGVDAVINDQPVVAYYLVNGGKGKMVGDIMEAEYYGIAAKKGNKALVKQVNEALAALKKNGEYDKIYKKWFGA